MTPAKPGMHTELIEPLREFLESFTQELTEQQFIPAFRDELRRMLAALERIQESGDTLQQIATGVDRLREVFAPSGTRMLEGVKELELLMKSNADGLKKQADDVLGDLLKTHTELETALRQEAGVLQEHTSVGKETLERTASEIEERLAALTGTIDGLCRKTEAEVAQLSEVSASVVKQVTASQEFAAQPSDAPVAVGKVELTEDLQKIFSRTETVVAEELSRYQSEVREALSSNAKESGDRLARIDKTIEEALKSVGPRVQEELDSALERLRDQIATLASVEAEVRQSKQETSQEQPPAVSDTVFRNALTTTENRVLKELAEIRKAGNQQLTSTEKAITDLALDLNEITEKHTERIFNENHTVKDSLARIERAIRDVSGGDEDVLKKLSETRSGISEIGKQSFERFQKLDEQFELAFGKLEEQSQSFDKLMQDDKQSLSQLKVALSRVEDAVNRSGQTLVNDTRAQRERIENGLNELRGKIDSRLDQDEKKYFEALGKLADDWTETLRALHGEIDAKIRNASESLLRHVDELGHAVEDSSTRAELIQKDLANDLKRASELLDERFEALQDTTQKFTGTMESHVKALSGDVSRLRSKQEDSLDVLKEAIRANYDDNAQRLRETIEQAYDKFLNQIRTIPQALDRYSKFIESLHQNDRLALESLQKETGTILRMQTERFNELSQTTGGMTKVFPLVDKKIEKQGQILEAMRRSQISQDKALEGLKSGLQQAKQETLNYTGDVKQTLQDAELRTNEKFREQFEMASTTYEQLEKLQRSDLPAFRQELKNLVTTKFEFMEATQTDRQTAWRDELVNRMERDRKFSRHIYFALGAGVFLILGLQVVLNLETFLDLLR